VVPTTAETAPSIDVVVHLAADPLSETGVTGQVESRYGTRPFTGWLDLLGQLESLLDRCRHEPEPPEDG
jgi:hypothetical protein